MTRHMSTDEYRQRRLELMSEDELLRAVVKLAHANGWLVHHQRPGRDSKGWRSQIIGDKGFPDLVLSRAGTVIFAEVKSEKGRLSEGQNRWIETIGAPAWTAACADHDHTCPHASARSVTVWRPSDWPTIVEILK